MTTFFYIKNIKLTINIHMSIDTISHLVEQLASEYGFSYTFDYVDEQNIEHLDTYTNKTIWVKVDAHYDLTVDTNNFDDTTKDMIMDKIACIIQNNKTDVYIFLEER